MKANEGHNREEIADTLWNYVGLSAGLYGSEIVNFTNTTLNKLENLQCELGRWILKVNRGIPNAAVRGELGWSCIKTKVASRKLNYLNRFLDLKDTNWTKMIYKHLVTNNIDTKWRLNIRILKGEIGFNRNEHKLNTLIRNWQIDNWKHEIENKKTLKLYKRQWKGIFRSYIDGSEEARAFFGVLNDSFVAHAWNEKKEPCPICLKSNWDDIHALFGCSGMVNDETVKKIIDEFGDLCGKSINTQSSFIEALQKFIKVQ